MARDHARINIAIWQDDDWRELPPPAQHLYTTLLTHPKLDYAGVVEWRPGRLAAMSKGWAIEDVEAAGDCLEARLFIVRDEATEECLVRSFVRFDGLMKQPRMAVSFANAFAGTSSTDIRGVIVHEAQKLRDADPNLGGWGKPQVQELLTKRAIDPRSRTLPIDPFRDGFTHRFTPSLGETRPDVKGSVSVSPTPAPTPAPITPAPRENEDPDFDAFWKAYPKKVDKGAARRAWVKAVKAADVSAIIAGAVTYAQHPDTHRDGGKYIKNPATWLNAESWGNELPRRDATPRKRSIEDLMNR